MAAEEVHVLIHPVPAPAHVRVPVPEAEEPVALPKIFTKPI